MSSVIAGAAGGFITFLLSLGFRNIQQRFLPNGDFDIFGTDREGKPFNVSLKNEALKSPQYDLRDLGPIASEKKTKDPQYVLENTSQGVKKVFAVAFIPDANMKTNGFLEIRLNGTRLFPIGNATAGMLKNITSFNIPIPPNFGLQLKQTEKFEVFIWTDAAATPVGGNIAVFLANPA